MFDAPPAQLPKTEQPPSSDGPDTHPPATMIPTELNKSDLLRKVRAGMEILVTNEVQHVGIHGNLSAASKKDKLICPISDCREVFSNKEDFGNHASFAHQVIWRCRTRGKGKKPCKLYKEGTSDFRTARDHGTPSRSTEDHEEDLILDIEGGIYGAGLMALEEALQSAGMRFEQPDSAQLFKNLLNDDIRASGQNEVFVIERKGGLTSPNKNSLLTRNSVSKTDGE